MNKNMKIKVMRWGDAMKNGWLGWADWQNGGFACTSRYTGSEGWEFAKMFLSFHLHFVFPNIFLSIFLRIIGLLRKVEWHMGFVFILCQLLQSLTFWWLRQGQRETQRQGLRLMVWHLLTFNGRLVWFLLQPPILRVTRGNWQNVDQQSSLDSTLIPCPYPWQASYTRVPIPIPPGNA